MHGQNKKVLAKERAVKRSVGVIQIREMIDEMIQMTIATTIDQAILNFRRLISWNEKKEAGSLNLANLNQRLTKLACCLLPVGNYRTYATILSSIFLIYLMFCLNFSHPAKIFEEYSYWKNTMQYFFYFGSLTFVKKILEGSKQ